MLEALDRKLLKLAEKVAKVFARATGKDNFDLARLIIKVVSAFLVSLGVAFLAIGAGYSVLFYVALFIFTACLGNAWLFIASIEKLSNRELETGAKLLEKKREIITFRRASQVFFFVVVCFSILLKLYILSVYGQWVFDFALDPLVLINGTQVVVSYLVEIDRPPLERIRVKEWIRSLFVYLKLFPAPSPA